MLDYRRNGSLVACIHRVYYATATLFACFSDRLIQRREATPEEIEALTLEGMKKAVSRLMHAGNMEVNIVGDFDAKELERCLLRYIGTIAPRPEAEIEPIRHFASTILSPPMEKRHTVWHLTDSDERASAYIAGPAPCRWGPYGTTGPLPPPPLDAPPVLAPPVFLSPNASVEEKKRAMELRRNHPLYQSVTLMLLTEIINSRSESPFISLPTLNTLTLIS